MMAAIGTECLLSPLFLFFSFRVQSFSPLHFPITSPANIMNRIQCVVPRLRGLHFHIDGFLGEAGKLDATVLIYLFFFPRLAIAWAEVGGELNPTTQKKPFYLKPRSRICRSSSLMNYVRGWEAAIIGAGGGGDGGGGLGWKERGRGVIHRCAGCNTRTHTCTLIH